MDLPTEYEGELSEVERDPRMLELAMRQHKARTAFTARQAQEYVIQALVIRRELQQTEKERK